MDTLKLLEEIQARELRDALEYASAWVVCAYHVEFPQYRVYYGTFREPAEAIAWAEEFRRELVEAPEDPEAERDEGWRCDVIPVMPTPDQALREEES